MPIFNTIHQLNNYVENVTMKEIGMVTEIYAEDVLIEKINDTVYRRKPKANYERTFSMLKSVSAFLTRNGRDRSVEVYPDTAKMNNEYPSYYTKGGKLDNRDSIVKWLDWGHGGFYKGNKVDYKGNGFMQKAMLKLEKTLLSKISQQLKLSGYIMDRESDT